MSNGEGALGHRSRKLIYNYISKHPGVSFGNIKAFFDMNKSTLKYHLNYLEKDKKVISKRDGRNRCYFCSQRTVSDIYKSTEKQVDVNTLNKSQRQILDFIQSTPGITQKELIRKTKLNRKNLSYHLKKLSELKIIWEVKRDGMIGYEFVTSEKLRDEILNQLVLKLLSDEIDEDTFNKIKKKLDKLDVDDIEI